MPDVEPSVGHRGVGPVLVLAQGDGEAADQLEARGGGGQQADTALADAAAADSVEIDPTQSVNARWLHDYRLGDLVSVVVPDAVIVDRVSAIDLTIDSAGVTIKPTVGDRELTILSTVRRARRLTRRLDRLEASK